MDLLHPAIIHFPIGMLSFYALLEVASIIPTFRSKLFTTKLLLVAFGTIASLVARLTGEHDAAYFTGITPTLQLHSQFSSYVVLIFGILTMTYVLEHISTGKRKKTPKAFTFLTSIYLRVALALAGFGIITIVGALGGAMVHGADVDPMVRFVTGLFGLR